MFELTQIIKVGPRLVIGLVVTFFLSACGGGGGGGSALVVVDTAPQTTITGSPTTPINSTSVTIAFSSNQTNSTFQCRLDNGSIYSCTSPDELVDLSDGAHRFEVRATNTNGTVDPTWAIHNWTVDTVSPSVSVTVGPQRLTTSSQATFSFSADEDAVSFECALDGGTFAVCETPTTQSELNDGTHTYEVRGQDSAGNQSNTAVYEWTIDGAAAFSGNTITGTVTTTSGGEGGVWVIAETAALPTPFRKIVVTDDDGRFLIPEVPDVWFDVWARGYGLLDSAKQSVRPGNEVTILQDVAPTEVDAAQIYPANYWYSLMQVPAADQFPGTGSSGNGINTNMENQAQWIDGLKDRCQLCHQMGNLATRVIADPESYASVRDGWDQRVELNGQMNDQMNSLGRDAALDAFTNWTDRIVAGETPEAPPRPDGIEQNIVLTQWSWSGVYNGFVHDNVSTDKRDPELYPDGSVFAVGGGALVFTDPETNESTRLDVPVRTSPTGSGANVHNPMFDDQNRLWMTSSIRPNENLDWCMNSDHPSVQRFPIEDSIRQLSYYDVASGEFVLIDTCYGTHHLQFADDDSGMLWLSGDYRALGWFDTKKFDETGDEQASQGWCPTVLDTNGNGLLDDDYVEPWDAFDESKDKRVLGFSYGIIQNPADGSVWFTRPYVWNDNLTPDRVPGQILRLDPETCLTEQYQPPFNTDAVPISGWGFSPRGLDIDRNGIIWTALSGSGHIASFDRSKCGVLNGPTATGQHCPEGWTLHPTPGPQMQGAATQGSADFHYYLWVDQFNTMGLGKNVPIANGTTSDSLIAWVPDQFADVQNNILTPNCAVSGCHTTASSIGGLDLSAGSSFASLVDVASSADSSIKRVKPGDPDNSYLMQKLLGSVDAGQQMPPGGPGLSESDIELVRDWIRAGAASEGRMVTLRVPYPLGFYQRGLDGRIDDPDAGWKGRGLWASNNTSVHGHIEGGPSMTSEIVRFQLRPHPLAD